MEAARPLEPKISIQIDFDDCTLGELDFIERYTGMSMHQIIADRRNGVTAIRTLTAIVFTLKRREDPTYTIDQAETVRPSQFETKSPDPTRRRKATPKKTTSAA